jgi:hypothetical protein
MRCGKSMSAGRNAVFFKIPLVVFLGSPKISGGNDLRDDFTTEAAGSVEFFFHLPRGAFLLCIVKEDYGSVLGSEVRPLAIQGCGIVVVEKYAQQFFVGNLRGIVVDLHNLSVAGAVGAYVLVSRVGQCPAHVTDRRICNAVNLPESALNSPKTSRAEGRFSHTHSSFFMLPQPANRYNREPPNDVCLRKKHKHQRYGYTHVSREGV